MLECMTNRRSRTPQPRLASEYLPKREARQSLGTSLEDLLHLRFRHRQLVDIVAEPLREIRLDWRRPRCIDLARRVFLIPQTLMAEHIPQMRNFGILHHLLSHLGRNEQHATIAAEHDIAGSTVAFPMRIGVSMPIMVDFNRAPLARLLK